MDRPRTPVEILVVDRDPERRTRTLEALDSLRPEGPEIGGVEPGRVGEHPATGTQRSPVLVVLAVDDDEDLELIAGLKRETGRGRTTVVALLDPDQGGLVDRAYDLGANVCLSVAPSGEGGTSQLREAGRFFLENAVL